MPTNWGEFLAGTEPKVTERYSKPNHLSFSNALVDAKVEYPNGVRGLVAQIIQKGFPQYVNNNNTTVSSKPAESGAVASYGGLNGDKVAAGKLQGDISTYTYKSKPVTGAFGATSDDVMEGVEVMLHELFHSRQQGNKAYTPNTSKLGSDWKELLKDADAAGFPSVGGGFQNGDNLEELLATAVPITEMRNKGMTPTGRFKDIPAALDKLSTKYPWLPDYIKENSNPEDAKAKQLTGVAAWLNNIIGH